MLPRPLLWLVPWSLVSGCQCDAETEPVTPRVPPPVVRSADDPPGAAEEDAPWPADPRQVTVHDAQDLTGLDLAVIEHLDLALSASDRVGYIEDGNPEDGCADLDLIRLGATTPALVSLRVSGCDSAVQSGLAAFADRLTHLELADMRIDGVVVGRVAQLEALEQLSLRRVAVGTDPLTPLRTLELQAVRLSELPKDSDISLLLDLWPKGLRSVVLEGSWAGHKAMLTLAKADALERLELRDTRVGNFSLNQIKPLSNLREVIFSGSTFNDNSPLYFRELPVTSFTCDCPRVGDVGLRSLRHSKGIRTLELRGTQISGVGLTAIEDLTNLESLVLTGIDVGPKGFEALAKFPKLRHLELSGELEHPDLANLELLSELQGLRLGYPDLDDRAAAQLATLTRLHELDLGRTRISDVGLEALSALTELQVLRLHHTRVTNRGLAALAGLQRLRVLELDHTDVVDAGVEHLAKLPALVELRLDSTLVTDAAVQHLLRLESLQRLNLGHTVVTDAGVNRLAALPQLETLGLAGTRTQPR